MANSAGSFDLEIDCPWCRRNVDFECRQTFDWRPVEGAGWPDYLETLELIEHDSRYNHRNRPIARKDAKDRINAYGFGTCPKCRHPVILCFQCTLRDLSRLNQPGVESRVATSFFANEGMKLKATVPAIVEPVAPNSAPDKVKELWPATLASLERRDPPSRIVAECRSILDVCLKELGAIRGGRKDRINQLKDRHILTQELADWGQILWDDGNDAVHDITATHEAAQQHVEYLKLFFQIAFDLRDKIAKRRAATQRVTSPP